MQPGDRCYGFGFGFGFGEGFGAGFGDDLPFLFLLFLSFFLPPSMPRA